MTTLTIEFPESVTKQVQARGISQQQLQKAIVHFVELYLAEPDDAAKTTERWTGGADFAKQLIANNRELFDELAKL